MKQAGGTKKRWIRSFLWRIAPSIMRWRWSRTNRWRWSIGILSGDSPFSIQGCEEGRNPALTWRDVTDVPAGFVADPFMIRSDGSWYMFFEVLNLQNDRGEIGLATSEDGVDWKYEGIVLKEVFHLSYPYVFEWQDEHFMIPEACQSGAVRLYKATRFPDQWSFVGNLLEGGRFADSSVFYYQDKWWMFTDAGEDSKLPVLRLYFSEKITGPWIAHPLSPVVDGNPHCGRPGGRVVVIDGRPIRFAQDLLPIYGSKVHAFEVTELSPTVYRERRVKVDAILEAGNALWNDGGMHHIDAHLLANNKWLACVDGFRRCDTVLPKMDGADNVDVARQPV